MGTSGRTALITGSDSGLGALIAEQLEDTYTVHRYDYKEHRSTRHPNDVRTPSVWLKEIERLDVLVNCAGVNRINWLENVSDDEWDLVMDVNVKGIFKMTQALLAPLAAAKGTVLNIVSNASHMPMRCSAAYNASKGAAHILTQQLARELFSRHGITVFGISPNRLAGTPMSASIDQQVCETRGWTIEKAREYQQSSLPIGEETNPNTLAEFIEFILSTKERHRYLHGCVIPYGL